MAYRPFVPKTHGNVYPATVATLLHSEGSEGVAEVATVAGALSERDGANRSKVAVAAGAREKHSPSRSSWTDADWHFAFEERAAILEFDAALPRHEAERLARLDVEALRQG
jgi:hypothetical protein